jgi:hypothetical protein
MTDRIRLGTDQDPERDIDGPVTPTKSEPETPEQSRRAQLVLRRFGSSQTAGSGRST